MKKQILLKHILAIIYVYLYILIHFELYRYLLDYRTTNSLITYFRGYFPVIILSVPVLYIAYQWLYFKINPKRRLLLSIGFLGFLVVTLCFFRYILENHANPFDVYVYRIFMVAGVLTAFVMGVFLDIIMKGLFLGHKLSLRKIEFTPSVFKHFLIVIYIYIYLFTLIWLIAFIESGIYFFNPVREDEYFYIFMFVTFLPVMILYFIYQWLYLKKLKYNRRLLSILFLEFFLIIVAVLLLLYKYNSENLSEYFLFIGSGILMAFIMGWVLDLLMRRLFRQKTEEE